MRVFLLLFLLATAAGAHPAYNIAADADGNLFFLDWPRKRVMRMMPGGNVSVFADLAKVAPKTDPHTLAVDAEGNVFVGATYAWRAWKITPAGKVSVLKLPDVKGEALLNWVFGPKGRLHVITRSDARCRILRFEADGSAKELWRSKTVDLYAGSMTVNGKGTVFVTHDGRVLKLGNGGKMSVFATGFKAPYGLCPDGKGGLVVADSEKNRIWRVASDGRTSTLAADAKFDQPYAVCPASKGRFFYTAEYMRGAIRIRVVGKKAVTLATVSTR